MSAGCCAVGVVVECSAEAVLEAVPQPWKHVVAAVLAILIGLRIALT